MASDDNALPAKLLPIRAEVVTGVIEYGDDVKDRCYALWAWRTARNCRAVERLYAAEAGEDAPVPSYNTIRGWSIRERWDERRRGEFALHHGETLYDMQLDTLAIMRRHIDTMAEAQSGAYDDNPAAGIVRLKAGELTGKIIERGVLPLMPKPIEQPKDTASMSREEQEAHATAAIARKKGTSA
jgi:hypothetical protein